MAARDSFPEGEMGFEPSYARLTSLRHYYGDPVRALFLGGAVVMLAASPLYASSLPTQLPFIIAGAVFAVGFAGLTNPRSRWILMTDAVIGGVGAILYGGWGIYSYGAIDPLAFALRIAIAIIFLFAFYFAMKSVRASLMHQIGQREGFLEFSAEELATGVEEDDEERSEREAEREGKRESWMMDEQ